MRQILLAKPHVLDGLDRPTNTFYALCGKVMK